MFKKVKKICFNSKALIIALIVLVVIGFGLTAYFGIKVINTKKEFAEIGPREKLEKIHSYALVLEKFEEFKTKQGAENTIAELERAVLATGSGVLKNLFDEMLLGENLEEDMKYFLDAVIDSLKFFSK
jgi:Zn-dependent M32 family carboxypeptidase